MRVSNSATWLGWVKALPDELIRARPVLCVGYAWALLNGGEFEAAEARLLDAERWLEPTTDMSERMEEPPTVLSQAEWSLWTKSSFGRYQYR